MPVELAHRILFRFFELALAKLIPSDPRGEGCGSGLAWLRFGKKRGFVRLC